MVDSRLLFRAISIIFSIAMGLLVVVGSLVMMFGNFELGVVLFVLGLVLIISNESILPTLRSSPKKGGKTNPDAALMEEVADLAAVGYAPPILLGAYIFISSNSDFKLIIFTGISFVVVTMKLFAKVAAAKLTYRASASEEIYSYDNMPEEQGREPGI